MRVLRREIFSLDETLSEEGDESHADLTPASELSLEEALAKKEWSVKAKEVVESMDDRTKRMFFMRFWEDKTLQEIGDTVGLSRERVRQIIEEKLIALSQEPALEDFEDID